MRNSWQLGIAPISNLSELLESLGLKVLLIELPSRVSGLTCSAKLHSGNTDGSVIVVNSTHTLERRRLTLAHELGHCLIDPSSRVDPEKAATEFASCFLMPRSHLIQALGLPRNSLSPGELIPLKRTYRVSAVALLMRLNQYQAIDDQTLTHAFQTYANGWRKDEPIPIEPEIRRGQFERPRRFELLCYHALAERYITLSKAVELLQVPQSRIEEVMRGTALLNDNSNL